MVGFLTQYQSVKNRLFTQSASPNGLAIFELTRQSYWFNTKNLTELCLAPTAEFRLKELLETVEDLKGREINLINLEERIDTTSAAGGLVFHVFGTIAQFERRLISQRTKGGLATARKQGRDPGRPPLQPETISALQDLVEAGKSVSQAAKHLGIDRSTTYKVISEAS